MLMQLCNNYFILRDFVNEDLVERILQGKIYKGSKEKNSMTDAVKEKNISKRPSEEKKSTKDPPQRKQNLQSTS